MAMILRRSCQRTCVFCDRLTSGLLWLGLMLVLVLGLMVRPDAAIADTTPTPIDPARTLVTPETSTPETSIPETSTTTILERARELTDRAFAATNRGDFAQAERLWSEILASFPNNAELWSNRGNARASQNHLEAAIADYDRAIELAPDQPDPYLNRGASLENAGRLTEAIADYNRVLAIDPDDPAAYNNRGNAEAAQGRWDEAIADYQRAWERAADFVIARDNYALALYQVGRTEEALRSLRNLVRKYPTFADPRAALTAVLWAQGDRGEAESQWVSVIGLDRRYKDLEWVAKTRRWPPAMVSALEKFLRL